MNKVAGVIFDWAGTTVDFGCFAPVNVFVKIFKTVGINVTIAEARLPMGILKRDHLKVMLEMPRISKKWQEQYGRGFNEYDIDELYLKFESMLLLSLEEYTQLLPGVIETVNKLRKNGLKIGSTTGYTDTMLNIVRQGAKTQGYKPDFWITPDSTNGMGRPNPYMIFRNMEALKLTAPWQVVKIGDTEADIKEGLNAGVWSVGVAVGSSQMGLSYDEFVGLSDREQKSFIRKTEQAFLNYGANFTIATMEELPELLKNINTLLAEGKRPYALSN